MVILAPVYLSVFTVFAPHEPIRGRYALFLVPVVAFFAAVALVAALRATWHVRRPVFAVRGLATIGTIALLATPAMGTVRLMGRYTRPDWRGCAEYLAGQAREEDVVIVFRDEPFGGSQPTFWGKYDWPADQNRPLAEPAWSLAIDKAHWQRLVGQTGRCFLVVPYRHPESDRVAYERSERKPEFLDQGLQHAPPGMSLLKFRGLDVLSRPDSAGTANERMLTACRDLIALPKQHPDSNAILYTLMSRLQYEAGDATAAAEALDTARKLVPSSMRGWFSSALAEHSGRIAGTVARSE